MLETVDVGGQDLDLYEPSAGAEAVAELGELAAPLEDAWALQVNATLCGGVVAACRDESYHSCSGSCRGQFKTNPEGFLRAMSHRS